MSWITRKKVRKLANEEKMDLGKMIAGTKIQSNEEARKAQEYYFGSKSENKNNEER